MPEEEQQEDRELREEAPAYYERYQQAREDYLIDQRYGSLEHPIDNGFQGLKEAIQRRTQRIQVFGMLTIGLEIAILTILVKLLIG